MSAAATKPRAKGAKSAKKADAPAAETPQFAMSEICRLLRRAEELIDQAREIGEPGDFGERLMRMAIDPTLTDLHRKLRSDAFSRDSVDAAIDVLADLQSLIDGAGATSGGARSLVLQQAFECTDSAYHLMDRPGFWPAEPQISQKYVDEQRHAFEDGRGMALEMLRNADRLLLAGTDDTAAAKRWCRGGKAQYRFAKIYLEWLMDNPETLEGFAAVLSAKLSCGGVIADEFDLSMAEFEAGEVGADGTESGGDEDNVPAERPTTEPVEEQTAPPQATGIAEDDAHMNCSNALEITKLLIWIERARCNLNKLSFWRTKSEKLRQLCDDFSINDVAWDEPDSDAMRTLLWLQMNMLDEAMEVLA
ncbi:hypothetical protein [Variovorax sp. JS1663]|uniref:hypothetical protein n=1 Tax=Variovorax sp. JS1663 TaxID=1851577 RepID=UPI000B347254|nr:hypothetical protein [Variovorax sp. JS1663]OUM01637.1 hypothetical protein A8M77_15300 [Variovorax sp. JS1663]